MQPGEIVSLTEDGVQSRIVAGGERRALCVFEHIYFARPDSRLGGQVLQVARGRMGELLAAEAPVEADLVIPVPDSGNPAARGFARASGLPQDDGLIKNRYVARTFIQPGQELRRHGLRMKFNPLPEVVAGRRLVVVDDSIVRGNTTRQIVQMLRDAGASEVHMRITAPPIRHPCHYGIDMSTREEMIAHGRTEAEVAAELGADSLAYLSLGGVYEAIRGTRETHCDACFSGEYPLARSGDGAAQGRVRERAPRASHVSTRGRHDFVPILRRRRFALRGRRYGRQPVSLAVDNVALPGLGPPPPEPVARARDPEGALRELFGFTAFRPGQREAVERRGRRPRRAGGHADRRGQVALLPAARAHARRT